MQRKVIFRFLWVICLLLIASLSCQLVEDIAEDVVETQIDSMITELIPTDIESIITDIGEIMPTDIEAMFTDIGGGDILETLMPEETEGAKPEDIPVISGGMDLLASETEIVYFTDTAFQKVVDFYETEMPKNGWTKVPGESKSEEGQTTLVFTKGDRKAKIEIADMFIQVGVTISITK
ncbi:MAG: hypothetical protein JXB15_01985 [Anaerolineales bacterium]|nr:hypothetical protein [Anaerolineales bacterium]